MKTQEQLLVLVKQLRFTVLGPRPDFNDIEVPCTAFIKDGAVTVSAEDGYSLVDYYGEFRGGDAYIHPTLEAFAEEHNMHWEWNDPGSISLYN